jgi:hypothetical protein
MAESIAPVTEQGVTTFDLPVLHHGATHTFPFNQHSTITDLSDTIASALSIPPSHQKFMITKLGLLKPPFTDPSLRLVGLQNRKIQLLAPLPKDLSSLARPATPTRPSSFKPVAAYKSHDSQRLIDEAKYTFHRIVPLPYLPHPERSKLYLERLRDDPGIKSAMRHHKFSVPTLTEMNPAEHTTHESKTLGLNRNRGEVIELRLRTDSYDGYRDYKTIRKTLCHELAHNVWGEHDRNFWDLCGQIEKEVEKGDWTRGGRSVASEEFYNPNDSGLDGNHVDGGGWQGGQFVLGGSQATGPASKGLSRRELMAKAAEERGKRERQAENGGDTGGSSTN